MILTVSWLWKWWCVTDILTFKYCLIHVYYVYHPFLTVYIYTCIYPLISNTILSIVVKKKQCSKQHWTLVIEIETLRKSTNKKAFNYTHYKLLTWISIRTISHCSECTVTLPSAWIQYNWKLCWLQVSNCSCVCCDVGINIIASPVLLRSVDPNSREILIAACSFNKLRTITMMLHMHCHSFVTA